MFSYSFNFTKSNFDIKKNFRSCVVFYGNRDIYGYVYISYTCMIEGYVGCLTGRRDPIRIL